MMQGLRLLINGFGFGVILLGTVVKWGSLPMQFRVFFCLALLITFYYAIRWAFPANGWDLRCYKEGR